MAFVMDDDAFKSILNEPGIREELHRVAEEQVLARATSLAAQAGLTELAASLRVEDGVRPGGRPYSRVIADHDDAERYEHGDSKTQRYRILGRAAGVRIWPDT